VPIEALDLALANWAAPTRATLGFTQQSSDGDALDRAGDASVSERSPAKKCRPHGRPTVPAAICS